MHSKKIYNFVEAGQALGLSRASLYRLVNSGQLRAVKVLGRTSFRAEEIEAFLKNLPDAVECGAIRAKAVPHAA